MWGVPCGSSRGAGMGWSDRFSRASRYLALCVASIGTVVLAGGWGLDMAALRTLLLGSVQMKPNTALALSLAGASLLLAHTARRGWQGAIAALVVLLTAVTLAQYLTGIDLGVDQLQFADSDHLGDQVPGRMAPRAAVNLGLAGLALLWLDARPRLAQGLALLLLVGAVIPLFGYSFSVPTLYEVGNCNSMALPSAVTCLLLALGILLARPTVGLMAVVASELAGGVVCRSLLPAIPAVIWVVALLRLAGETRGYYDMRFGLALMVTGSITVCVAVIVWVAGRLNREDGQRRRAEAAVGLSEARFRLALDGAPHPSLMVDKGGRITLLKTQAEALFGYARAELIGQPVEVLIPSAISGHPPELVAGYVGAPQVRPLARGGSLGAVCKDGSSVPV